MYALNNDMNIKKALLDCGIYEDSLPGKLYIGALEIAMEEPDRLNHMIKGIYHPLSLEFGLSMSVIERTMRETVVKIYTENRVRICIFFDKELERCPTVSEFLRLMLKRCMLVRE